MEHDDDWDGYRVKQGPPLPDLRSLVRELEIRLGLRMDECCTLEDKFCCAECMTDRNLLARAEREIGEQQ